MTNENDLMTVQQFNNAVTKWALIIKERSKKTLHSNTHASGQLALNLDKFVDKDEKTEAAYKIKFHFLRYGVYRAYGAGRGYVIVNGLPVRGYRIRSDREISNHKFGLFAQEYLHKGYTIRQINTAKKVNTTDVRRNRKALDWIDKHINASIQDLADTVQEFYGDAALKAVLENMKKLKIVKQ